MCLLLSVASASAATPAIETRDIGYCLREKEATTTTTISGMAGRTEASKTDVVRERNDSTRCNANPTHLRSHQHPGVFGGSTPLHARERKMNDNSYQRYPSSDIKCPVSDVHSYTSPSYDDGHNQADESKSCPAVGDGGGRCRQCITTTTPAKALLPTEEQQPQETYQRHVQFDDRATSIREYSVTVGAYTGSSHKNGGCPIQLDWMWRWYTNEDDEGVDVHRDHDDSGGSSSSSSIIDNNNKDREEELEEQPAVEVKEDGYDKSPKGSEVNDRKRGKEAMARLNQVQQKPGGNHEQLIQHSDNENVDNVFVGGNHLRTKNQNRCTCFPGAPPSSEESEVASARPSSRGRRRQNDTTSNASHESEGESSSTRRRPLPKDDSSSSRLHRLTSDQRRERIATVNGMTIQQVKFLEMQVLVQETRQDLLILQRKEQQDSHLQTSKTNRSLSCSPRGRPRRSIPRDNRHHHDHHRGSSSSEMNFSMELVSINDDSDSNDDNDSAAANDETTGSIKNQANTTREPNNDDDDDGDEHTRRDRFSRNHSADSVDIFLQLQQQNARMHAQFRQPSNRWMIGGAEGKSRPVPPTPPPPSLSSSSHSTTIPTGTTTSGTTGNNSSSRNEQPRHRHSGGTGGGKGDVAPRMIRRIESIEAM